MPNHKSALQRIKETGKKRAIVGVTALTAAMSSYSFDSSYYAENSVLSQGNWAKIEVSRTGMQFISDATLQSLGFSDPSKVNIYGYGGVVIPENLDTPDDLPMVSSIRVNGGIVFFGRGNVGWTLKANSTDSYNHQSHPYSDHAYYFVSDMGGERKGAAAGVKYTGSGEPVTVFTERLVHEQDLSMPMTSGRLMLGEDFRTTTTRNFQFSLPGNTGNATVTTAFGCKTTSGTSSIVLTANGKQLGATSNDQMAFSSSKLIVTTTTVKEVENPGDNLQLTIKFNGSGTVKTAGLDYIEVEYPRSLTMTGGQLYFYISAKQASEVKVSGAGTSTIVWDVTDPVSPVVMPTELNGTTLSFVSEQGYHEYVAFDPQRIGNQAVAAGNVGNQNLHALEAPDMLVICPQEYTSAARRLADLHKLTDGLRLEILTPEEIYNEYSCGKPDVSAFRKLMKMWYDRAGGVEGKYPSHCLIMSRPTYDNKMVTSLVRNCGYPRVPIWQSATGETETTSYSTDDYIGMLKDVNGTFNIGTAEINVAVGRMPVKSLKEANTAIDKLEEYLLRPDLGSWRNNVIVIADDQDNGVHLEQAESVVENMRNAEKGNDYMIEKLYLDAYPLEYTATGASYPLVRERLFGKWNEGTAFIDYIGHANTKSWGHEGLLTWTDITTMANSRLPFIYAATCEFMRWDEDDITGAEVLWLYPSSGVIGMICPSREVLITANGVLNRSCAKYIFAQDSEGNPLTVGEIMRKGKNDSNTGTNKLRYGIIGDPTLRLPWASLNVRIEKINGIELGDAESLPELKARSQASLEGVVTDRFGNVLEDFNGVAEVTLYDAEKVVTTNGNGSDGVVSVYNDRKTRLYKGRMNVKDGKWSTQFTMPSEIENNYSPAFITVYAYDSDGREASGSTDKLYAYGYDTTAPDDFEGPKIIEFYLNSPAFVNGAEVSPSPVLRAKFYDESGISVSEAGIGHNITLSLDGKTFYDDVAQYYEPDLNKQGMGSISYPLGEVSQGNHRLSLTVWDNANNSTTASLDFVISALWKPTIETLTTDVNPATSSVNFIIATDGSSSSMGCIIEVYDLWGKKVWSGTAPAITSGKSRTTLNWDLCDFSGGRVQSGVYLYKATVKTNSGATVTKTKKLLVK